MRSKLRAFWDSSKAWLAGVRALFARLVQTDEPREAPAPRRERPSLEPVTFRSPQDRGTPPVHLVVDFGTTATVVASVQPFRDYYEKVVIEARFLVGRVEQSSDMVVDEIRRTVLAIGRQALEFPEPPVADQDRSIRYFSSVKRYVELLSRTDKDKNFADIVSGFLEKALQEAQGGELPAILNGFGSNSTIIVSVPNSFNAKAVACISNGVIQAIGSFRNDGNFNVSRKNVRIVRESEAVAHLYLDSREAGKHSRLKPPSAGVEGESKKFEWRVLAGGTAPHDGEENVIAVLDVGGGTTDLSVVEIRPGRGPAVIMNAGIPLGGSDVDKLILHSALIDEDARRQVSKWTTRRKGVLLHAVRIEKDANCAAFFGGGDDWQSRLATSLGRIVGALGQNRELGLGLAAVAEFDRFVKLTSQKVDLLTALSVEGLFDLIPDRHRSRIQTIILTGRGSLLPQIAESAERCARGARVVTIAEPYQLKLAVACGCALLVEAKLDREVPGQSLGRTIRFDRIVGELLPDYPIAGDAPTLWSFRSPNSPDEPRPVDIWEYRTAVRADLINDINDLISLGCGRRIAYWQPDLIRSRYLLWDPETDSYLPSARPVTGQPHWGARQSAALDLRSRNCVTGFSIGFPHED